MDLTRFIRCLPGSLANLPAYVPCTVIPFPVVTEMCRAKELMTRAAKSALRKDPGAAALAYEALEALKKAQKK